MLYLLFFLLRDGSLLSARLRAAIPLSDGRKTHLLRKFTAVIRATVKGNIAVAAAQGALGGVIFYVLGIQGPVLWSAVLMASFELARVARAYDYRSFFRVLLGRGWFVFEIGYFLLMLVILAVMGAAAGEIVHSLFGLPDWKSVV